MKFKQHLIFYLNCAGLRKFCQHCRSLPQDRFWNLVLEKHSFSMPVGRISYVHLEPLSFEEFLQANGKQILLDYLHAFQWGSEIQSIIHEQFMALFKEYLIIGGMPAAVARWVDKRSLNAVSQVHHDLMATYRDDIAKYRGRIGQND